MVAARLPTVAELLSALDHPHKAGIERLRTSILSLDSRITEEVKWNAPSFRLHDHFATFRLHPPKGIQLVLHTGAKSKSNTRAFAIDDPDSLLKWQASDRCVLTLVSTEDLAAREAAVLASVRQWITQL